MIKKTDLETGRKIPPVFDPKIGATLKEVAVDVIESDGTSLTSRWFHSKNDVDLFVWLGEDGELIKTQMNFLGQVAQWTAFDGTRTGLLIETEVADEEMAEKLHFDQAPVWSVVAQTIELISNVSDLDPKDREKLISHFSSSRRSKSARRKKTKQEIKLSERSANRSNFLQRLQKWFSGHSK